MDGYSLMFCVIRDFDLVTKGSLAIDACTCFNNRKIRLRLASLSAGSSDGITKFKLKRFQLAYSPSPPSSKHPFGQFCFERLNNDRDFSLLSRLEVSYMYLRYMRC